MQGLHDTLYRLSFFDEEEHGYAIEKKGFTFETNFSITLIFCKFNFLMLNDFLYT